jgi:hypothetical protein
MSSSLSNVAVAGAIYLLNTESGEALKEYFKKQATKTGSVVTEQMSSEKGRKEITDKGVDALRKALDYFRYNTIKDLKVVGTQLNTFRDYAYQKTLNSQSANEIVSSLTGEKTEEDIQRRLEKILYLYLLDKGLNMTTPIDIQIMTEDQENELFTSLLADGSSTREEIEEMVRNLLTLFFYGRMGISGVQYSNNLGKDTQLIATHKEIVEKDRRKTIDGDIESSVTNKEFLRHFLDNIIKDYASGSANDSKYYGTESNHIQLITHRVRNLINEHNRYTDYIKSGNGLQKEIDKISRLVVAINNIRPFIEEGEKGQLSAVDKAINNMVKALQTMKQPRQDGKLHIYTFKTLDELLSANTPDDVITNDVKIVNVNAPSGANQERDNDNDEPPKKRARAEEGNDTIGGGKTKKRRFRLRRKSVKKTKKNKKARGSKYAKKAKNTKRMMTRKRSRRGGMHHGKPHKKTRGRK